MPVCAISSTSLRKYFLSLWPLDEKPWFSLGGAGLRAIIRFDFCYGYFVAVVMNLILLSRVFGLRASTLTLFTCILHWPADVLGLNYLVFEARTFYPGDLEKCVGTLLRDSFLEAVSCLGLRSSVSLSSYRLSSATSSVVSLESLFVRFVVSLLAYALDFLFPSLRRKELLRSGLMD